MYTLLWFLIGWFVGIIIKKIVFINYEENKHLQKWKMVNNWKSGGNSVRRNVSGLFKKENK